MFKASAFEYRFRFLIHAVIYMLGFWAPWVYIPFVMQHFALTSDSTLLVLPLSMARVGWLPPFSRTTGDVMIVVALLFTGLGAWLRIWGSAYVGSSVVASRSMHGEAMLADGPYRHTRNPLYLGTLLHTLGCRRVERSLPWCCYGSFRSGWRVRRSRFCWHGLVRCMPTMPRECLGFCR